MCITTQKPTIKLRSYGKYTFKPIHNLIKLKEIFPCLNTTLFTQTYKELTLDI